MCEGLIDVRKFQNVLGQRVHVFLRGEALCERHQQIQIPNCFFAATQRSGGCYAFRCLAPLLNMHTKSVRGGFRPGQQKTPSRPFERFNRFQDVLLALFSEAFHIAQLAFLRNFLHILNGSSLEFLPQQRSFLGTE